MAKFNIDFLPEFSEQTLIEELQRLARALGKDTLSRRDIDQHGKMSSAVRLAIFLQRRRRAFCCGLT